MVLSSTTFLILLKLPFNILLVALQTWFLGGKYRKYSHQIWEHIKLYLYHSILGVPPTDNSRIAPSNSILINQVVGRKNSIITSQLPGYGERYDKNSIWLVKQQSIKPTDPILIYLHGGGFFVQTSPTQIETLISIYQLSNANVKGKLSVLLLDYTLAANGVTVPHQLYQLHETYSKLVSEGFNNFITIGDSAGGHLSLTHLQLLKQKNFSVFPKLTILISPWVKLLPGEEQYVPGKSYYDNKGKDLIEYVGFSQSGLVQAITGNKDLNNLLVSPGNKTPHDRKDWEQIPTLNDPGHSVFVLAGEDEVFRDDILEWAEYALGVPLYSDYKYGDSNNKYDKEIHEYVSHDNTKAHVRVYVEPWGVHIPILLLENDIIGTLKKNPTLEAKDIDSDKYFGISRVVSFLNDTIE